MKQMMKVGLLLAIICAVAATALAAVNMITKDKIAAYERNVVIAALSEVASGFSIGESQASTDALVQQFYPLAGQSKTVEGYLLMLNANGYGGAMTVMASYSKDGKILAAKLLGNSETPGLGKKAESKTYMDKFIGTGGASPVPVKKSNLSSADAESIGGATVTFSGIAKALAYGSEFVKTVGVK